MGIVYRIGAGASALVLGGSLLLGARDTRAHQGLDVLEPAMADEIARRPSDPVLRLEQAQVFEAGGEWDRALAALDAALALGADPDEVSGLRGRVLLAAGRLEDATRELDRLIARRPDAPGPYYQRGLARLRAERPADAARDFERAVLALPQPAPQHVLAWRDALVAAGKPADAVRALDRGMLRVGQVPSLELAAVDLEVQLGRHRDALRRMDRLIAQSPRNPAWIARRGELLERTGASSEARASYQQALAMITARPAARRSHRTAALERRLRAALAHTSDTSDRGGEKK
jgi:tetratricopeptide (TPR) repeat protein